MITQKSNKLSRQCVRNPSKDLMSFKVINRHSLKNRVSINDGLFSYSFRIRVGLPLKLLSYVKAVSAAFKGRGVQMDFYSYE